MSLHRLPLVEEEIESDEVALRLQLQRYVQDGQLSDGSDEVETQLPEDMIEVDENQRLSNEPKVSCWIFGYGSLCWNPGFEYENCLAGYIRGYVRRFWQGNTTHRGTIDKVREPFTILGQYFTILILFLLPLFNTNLIVILIV